MAIHFLQGNAKFYSCTQRGIRFSTTEYKILKVVPERAFLFPTRKYEIKLFIINLVSFVKNGKKIKRYHFEISYFVVFIMKDKIRNINETLKYKLFAKSVITLWITENSSPVSTTASSK